MPLQKFTLWQIMLKERAYNVEISRERTIDTSQMAQESQAKVQNLFRKQTTILQVSLTCTDSVEEIVVNKLKKADISIPPINL